ncbi:MAG: carboxylating nicotinate-nucleotide diphosphorylase [Planctomycetota bacterium]|nr:carboxylating nicotinate-nucleotide diphosphorylase [Planctomycetota bacterium]
MSTENVQLPAPRRGLPQGLPHTFLDPLLLAALKEDVESGDLTGDGAVPERVQARAVLVAKEVGVLAGLQVFLRTFALCDSSATFESDSTDGDAVSVGQTVATVTGNARAILRAERVALNFLQRLSGTASLTAKFVERVAHVDGVRILDTRKTTPGLRRLEKYAVRCGGGENHRFGLFDEAMLKENHIALAGSSIEEALERLRKHVGPGVRITAEARDEAEAMAALRGGADVLLLDNMTPDFLTGLCPRLRGEADRLGRCVELEASGGIVFENVHTYGEAGVDRISVGALTHSADALDFSLILEPIR